MKAARTLATAARVLRQLRNDPRTLALLFMVPVVLMGLLPWILPERAFDAWGAPLLGVFPLIVMFLVTSVASLRERTGGTLERLLSMPLGKGDLIFGYAVAFALLGVAQAAVVSAFAFGPFGLDVRGSPLLVGLVAVVDGLLGTALGLSASAFAATEFQAVQFLPLVLLPQLLCGLIVETDDLPDVLRWVGRVLPLTYAVDAAREVQRSTQADVRVRGRRRAGRRLRRRAAAVRCGDPAPPHRLTAYSNRTDDGAVVRPSNGRVAAATPSASARPPPRPTQ